MSFSVDLWNGIDSIKNQINSTQKKIKTIQKLVTSYINIEANYSKNLENLFKELKDNTINLPESGIDESIQKIVEIFDYENHNRKILYNYLNQMVAQPINDYLEKPKIKLNKSYIDNTDNNEYFNKSINILIEKQGAFHAQCKELGSYIAQMEIDKINNTSKTSQSKCQKILEKVKSVKEEYLDCIQETNKDREKFNYKTEEILNYLEEEYRIMVKNIKTYLINFSEFRLNFLNGLYNKEKNEFDNIHSKLDDEKEVFNFITKNATKEFPMIKIEFCPIKYNVLNKYIKSKYGNKVPEKEFSKIFKNIKDYFDSNEIYKDDLLFKPIRKINEYSFTRRLSSMIRKSNPNNIPIKKIDKIQENKEFLDKYITDLFIKKECKENKDNNDNKIKENQKEKINKEIIENKEENKKENNHNYLKENKENEINLNTDKDNNINNNNNSINLIKDKDLINKDKLILKNEDNDNKGKNINQNKDNVKEINNNNKNEDEKNKIYENINIEEENNNNNQKIEDNNSEKSLEDIVALIDNQLNINNVLYIELLIRRLSYLRSKGFFQIKNNSYYIIISLFSTILRQNSKNDYILKNIIILCQTFYKLENNEKIYLQQGLKGIAVFEIPETWHRVINYSLNLSCTDKDISNLKKGDMIKKINKESKVMVMAYLWDIKQFTDNEKVYNQVKNYYIKIYNMDEKKVDKDVEDFMKTHHKDIFEKKDNNNSNNNIKSNNLNYTNNNNSDDNNNNKNNNVNQQIINNNKENNINDKEENDKIKKKLSFVKIEKNDLNDIIIDKNEDKKNDEKIHQINLNNIETSDIVIIEKYSDDIQLKKDDSNETMKKDSKDIEIKQENINKDKHNEDIKNNIEEINLNDKNNKIINNENNINNNKPITLLNKIDDNNIKEKEKKDNKIEIIKDNKEIEVEEKENIDNIEDKEKKEENK